MYTDAPPSPCIHHFTTITIGMTPPCSSSCITEIQDSPSALSENQYSVVSENQHRTP
jgi:hypothetical protein